MWIDPDDDPREQQSAGTDERSILIDYLRRYRLTMQMKCADLDAAQMARRSVPPSTMSLLGLVRHLADVERSWFRITMSGLDVGRIFRTAENPDEDFDGAVGDPAVVAAAWAALHEEQVFTDRFVAASADLGVVSLKPDEPISLREVLVHLIEEYARHNGHADLLRELIDGRLGQ
jgi:uncharacterized damage-inducible protein DinB